MSKRPADADDHGPPSKRRQTPLLIPTFSSITPWVASEIPSQLPAIPKILDEELERTVYRHPGLSGGEASYEYLEWLGDAYLELISSALIFRTFDGLSAGRRSQLRELLIRNITISQYFREYGLHHKAEIPHDLNQDVLHSRGTSKDKDIVKVHADMFEAYVAAAIISDPEKGLENTIFWLKALFGRTIRSHIERHEKQTSSVPDGKQEKDCLPPKDQLRKEIGSKGVNIRYESLPGPKKDRDSGLQLFTVGVFLDGWGESNKLLGIGTALGKKEAGSKAAMRALENTKLMNSYKAKKDALRQAQEAAANEASILDSQ